MLELRLKTLLCTRGLVVNAFVSLTHRLKLHRQILDLNLKLMDLAGLPRDLIVTLVDLFLSASVSIHSICGLPRVTST